MATSKGLRWYENAPERISFVKQDATGRNISRSRYQVYHFLAGDPGMCDYDDKVIKSLEPEKIKIIKEWNKRFTAPYSEDEFKSLIGLSKIIDVLWKEQIKARHELEENTITPLDVFGHRDSRFGWHRSIREKDKILATIYKSEKAQNAGAYARLKFAMDYWCALWFWPISEAELLPSRAEYINDMDMILNGVMQTESTNQQMSLFETNEEGDVEICAVNLSQLCDLFPRLNLVKQIAEQNHFMHWELEFADLFADKGGFDLIIGNPPWILLEWNEQNVLSERNPSFAIHELSAADVANNRDYILKDTSTYKLYFNEYICLTGQQLFLNAITNYSILAGMKANLYKCFLPQSWTYLTEVGVSAFVHPDGVFDDPKGGKLRTLLYPKLRKHFQFENELSLFEGTNDHGRMRFALNVYCNSVTDSFETISNLFSPETVDECYDMYPNGEIPGIKDSKGNWNTNGHPGRVVHVGKQELKLFSKLFDDSENWEEARLPMLHAQVFLNVLEKIVAQSSYIASIPENEIAYAVMFFEAADAKRGIIERNVHFPENCYDAIISGPHIGVANPRAKTSRSICKSNGDYDCVDLTQIDDNYLARCNYRRHCSEIEFINSIINVPWGKKYHETYRIGMRKMLNLSGERTLIAAIIAPGICHIDGIYSMTFKSGIDVMAGCMASLPYDFYIKTSGKSNGCYNVFSSFPNLEKTIYAADIAVRSLTLNCITNDYSKLWGESWRSAFTESCWTKEDQRLVNTKFSSLLQEWKWNTPLRNDYERRQALVEIDVLVAMALGIKLEELKNMYLLQFPVLQQNEADTWYDVNGRIVFTNNKSLTGVGFTRPEWESGIKDAPAGQKFYRKITDDTMPGGPIERTIEYVAPFDRCDREQDYETAWKFFEKKYGGD